MAVKNNQKLTSNNIIHKSLGLTAFARKVGMEELPLSKKKLYASMPREEYDKAWDERRKSIRNDWSSVSPYLIFREFDYTDFKFEYELSQHCPNYWIYLIHNPYYRDLLKKDDFQKACKLANVTMDALHDYYIDCLINVNNSIGYRYYKLSRKNGHSLSQWFNIPPIDVPDVTKIQTKFSQISDQLIRIFISRKYRRDIIPTDLEENYMNDLLLDIYGDLKDSWDEDCFDAIVEGEFEPDDYYKYVPKYGGHSLEWLFNPDDCMYISDFICECEHYNLDFSIFRSICIEKLNEHNRNYTYANPIDFDETFNPANEHKIRESLFRVL